MKTEDKAALNEFMRSFLFGIGVLGIFIIPVVVMNTSANWLEMQPTPQDERFKVVDKYRGCEVVRYTPQNDAKYHYLMYC